MNREKIEDFCGMIFYVILFVTLGMCYFGAASAEPDVREEAARAAKIQEAYNVPETLDACLIQESGR